MGFLCKLSGRSEKMCTLAVTAALATFMALPSRLSAQREPPPSPDKPSATSPDVTFGPTLTMLGRLKTDRIWISGQVNIISQWHPAFHSPYQGANSLSPEAQDATSRVFTLYTGLRVSKSTEFLCDVQETGGHGLGEALGVAGFMNLDVVRNPLLTKAPYVARLMWHQIIPLGEAKPVEPNAYSLFRELPERRLEFRLGKFSLPDYFDLNGYGADPNFQFMNWTVDNNGAYDYAADTRGYTFGAMAEYHQGNWAVRFAETLMPKVANGIHLDADFSRARAENVEWEWHGEGWRKRSAAVHVLAYVNHGNMGSYRDAVNDFLAGRIKERPDITAHPLRTTVKYGFGINFEQGLTDWINVFGRWGWNEGRHESFAYTEVDETEQIGLGGNGSRWGRKYDRLGLVFVSNGISRDHQEYLKLGGLGFMLGDGTLRYGREDIFESFYTGHLWRGVFPAFGVQYIVHPGYNRDRGPVVVPSARLHIEF
jgi:high affinity Mn2+ porin